MRKSPPVITPKAAEKLALIGGDFLALSTPDQESFIQTLRKRRTYDSDDTSGVRILLKRKKAADAKTQSPDSPEGEAREDAKAKKPRARRKKATPQDAQAQDSGLSPGSGQA